MFVKIVRHIVGNGVSDSKGRVYEKVIPTESVLYEVSSVTYRKMNNKPDELEKGIEAMLDSFDGPITVIRASGYEKADSDSLGSECIVVEMVMPDGSKENIVGIDCQMFVMNDSGKTVEAVSCGSY